MLPDSALKQSIYGKENFSELESELMLENHSQFGKKELDSKLREVSKKFLIQSQDFGGH